MGMPAGATAFIERGGDPVFYAQSVLRKGEHQVCVDICSELLLANPYDQSVWYLKCQALTAQSWIDDTEMEEEGVAELLLEQNAIAQAPRPGTSLSGGRAAGGGGGGINQAVRPMTGSGRPLTGFARPGTSSKPVGGGVEGAFQGGRPGTSRPVTSSGRFVRLGTASMLGGSEFINIERLDFRKYAQRPALAKVLCDYIIYHLRNPKKALELASLATQAAEYKDWWWKARLGKCYYQLGLYRDAEQQFRSVLKERSVISIVLELCKVYIKMDQPMTALEQYTAAVALHPGDTSLLIRIARMYDQLNDERSMEVYRKVCQLEPGSIESLSCLASNYFYNDQPELALRFYRRLLQMGLDSTELWCNIGLCCFYASQYDMCLNCFEKAVELCDDSNAADVWYNVGQVAIGIGDLGLAYQAFKISVSIDINHAESFNNLGVLELRKHNPEAARGNFKGAHRMAEHLFEPLYNSGLLAYKLGDLQGAFADVNHSLERYAENADGKELLSQLAKQFVAL